MKSKLVILSLLLAGVASTATAQYKETFYSDNFKDNIFIGIGGGAQVCVNPDNSDYGIGNAITPILNISVGKLFNPIWGVRLQAAGAWSRLYSEYGLADGLYKKLNKHYVTTRIEGLYNLSNAIYGYNPNRLFTLSAFAGPGLTFAKAFGDQKTIDALINGSVGLMGQFNICENWDINVEARGEVSPSIFGSKSSAYTDGAVSLTVGTAYTFGGKKFVSCKPVDNTALNNAINECREQLSQCLKDLADTQDSLKNVKPEIKEVVHEKTIVNPMAVFFKIGSAKIDGYGKVNIKLIADAMKANPDAKYKIAGYADKATGSISLNKKLSEKRAKVVYNALIDAGVSKDQLIRIGFGGTSNMFGKNYLNRVVIMK
ncbi:MAG: OmpA family protein [Bacteroidaceae bacterium]|nr:OmpA family protein [Bacteroidaceae bacterium]